MTGSFMLYLLLSSIILSGKVYIKTEENLGVGESNNQSMNLFNGSKSENENDTVKTLEKVSQRDVSSENNNVVLDVTMNTTLPHDEKGQANQQINKEQPTDEIPTFIEYRQMLEKETKAKQEKSQSNPKSPTKVSMDYKGSNGLEMNIKGNNVKGGNGAGDQSSTDSKGMTGNQGGKVESSNVGETEVKRAVSLESATDNNNNNNNNNKSTDRIQENEKTSGTIEGDGQSDVNKKLEPDTNNVQLNQNDPNVQQQHLKSEEQQQQPQQQTNNNGEEKTSSQLPSSSSSSSTTADSSVTEKTATSVASDVPLSSGSDTTGTHDSGSAKVDAVLPSTTDGTAAAMMAAKNNVAGKECGAKMLGFTSEMLHAGSLLNSNKDEYMNVPCSANNKWFIFETCEPILIRSIQIANHEMFSSRLKTFKVYASDRYPVKHWHTVGYFRSLDQNGVQTFDVVDTNLVKYVKVEMLDHYGTEHYCPLTFIRIYGNAVIDDDIDDEPNNFEPGSRPTDNEKSSSDITASTEHTTTTTTTTTGENGVEKNEEGGQGDEKKSGGILTKAKNMIVKMVNGIGRNNLKNNAGADSNSTMIFNIEHEWLKESSNESSCYFLHFLLHIQKAGHNLTNTLNLFCSLKPHLMKLNDDISTSCCPTPSPLRGTVKLNKLMQSIQPYNFDLRQLSLSFSNLTNHYENFSDDYFQFNSTWITLFNNARCSESINKMLIELLPSNSAINSPKIPNILIDKSQNEIETGSTANGRVYNHSFPDLPNATLNINDVPDSPIINGTGDSVVSDQQQMNGTLEDTDGKQKATETQTQTPATVVSTSTNSNGNSNAAATTSTGGGGGASGTSSGSGTNAGGAIAPGSNAWNHAFMRMKNLARQLELNVSISMKYLEQLSENYKLQTERLRRSQLQTASNLSVLETSLLRYRKDMGEQLQQLRGDIRLLITVKRQDGFSRRYSGSGRSKRVDSSLSLSLSRDFVKLLIFNIIISLPVQILLSVLMYYYLRHKLYLHVSHQFYKQKCHQTSGIIETMASSSFQHDDTCKTLPKHILTHLDGDKNELLISSVIPPVQQSTSQLIPEQQLIKKCETVINPEKKASRKKKKKAKKI